MGAKLCAHTRPLHAPQQAQMPAPRLVPARPQLDQQPVQQLQLAAQPHLGGQAVRGQRRLGALGVQAAAIDNGGSPVRAVHALFWCVESKQTASRAATLAEHCKVQKQLVVVDHHPCHLPATCLMSGWLHTLRISISTLFTPLRLPRPPPPAALRCSSCCIRRNSACW